MCVCVCACVRACMCVQAKVRQSYAITGVGFLLKNNSELEFIAGARML